MKEAAEESQVAAKTNTRIEVIMSGRISIAYDFGDGSEGAVDQHTIHLCEDSVSM
jgi:hypothetical protein